MRGCCSNKRINQDAVNRAPQLFVTTWISPPYLKEIETIKTCNINISDFESQGGAFCYWQRNCYIHVTNTET
jgi:hypothetical protein